VRRGGRNAVVDGGSGRTLIKGASIGGCLDGKTLNGRNYGGSIDTAKARGENGWGSGTGFFFMGLEEATFCGDRSDISAS